MRSQPSRSPLPDSALPALRAGCALLLQAHEYAADLQRSVWDFAVEIADLHQAGLTGAHLRQLDQEQYVEQAVEIEPVGEEARSFHQHGIYPFTEKSCFVLTQTGYAYARWLCLESPPLPRLDPGAGLHAPLHVPWLPHWDADRRELHLGPILVKRFLRSAPNQERILAVFQEEGWASRIDDPLPQDPYQNAQERLHDTIKNLNRNQVHALIRFLGDGTGCGVRWELTCTGAAVRSLLLHQG